MLSIMHPNEAARAAQREWATYEDAVMSERAASVALVAAHQLVFHDVEQCGHDEPRDCGLEVIPEVKQCFTVGDPARAFVTGITLALVDGSLGTVPNVAHDDDPGWYRQSPWAGNQ